MARKIRRVVIHRHPQKGRKLTDYHFAISPSASFRFSVPIDRKAFTPAGVDIALSDGIDDTDKACLQALIESLTAQHGDIDVIAGPKGPSFDVAAWWGQGA